MEFNIGDKLCNCTLLQKCGCGAYGEVWIAEDPIGTRVALKILHGKYSEREFAGLKCYKDCNHPNLLKIRYVEINDDLICYTMDAADDLNGGRGEYLPDTLANRLNKRGRLDGKEITAMVEDLLAGLEELHGKGLVHRDIKPDNIIWVNGRATLADVGLIANDGANSLAGTPEFISPRVLGGKPAEASDDFYALGKVIYCAMTGLAAKEYPSLPADMTISVDANLNRAVRESCTNPINSTVEFRQLLEGKNIRKSSVRKADTEKKIIWDNVLKVLFVSVLILILFYFFGKRQVSEKDSTVQTAVQNSEQISVVQRLKKMEEKHVVKPVDINPEDEKRLIELQNADKDFQKELQTKVLDFFEKSGLLNNNNMLLFLVNYQLMKREEMLNLILNSNGDPRLVPTAGVHRKTVKNPTRLEQTLFSMLMVDYFDFDESKVRERQHYWKKHGDIKAMLTTDTLMQAVAIDCIIRHGINTVLENCRFRGTEESDMKELLSFRRFLLDPEWGKLQYLSKKNKVQNR